MRVLFVGSDKSIITQPNGGSCQRQLRYAKYFTKLYIIVFSLKKDHLSTIQVSNLIVIPTNSTNRWFFLFNALKIISRLKVDIISAQDPFIAGLVGVIAKLFWGSKLNIQLHIDMFKTDYFRKESLQNNIFYWLSHITFFFADSVRAGSKRLLLWPKAFLARVPMALDYFWHQPRNKIFWRVVTVGRLVSQKNFALFVEVAKKLKKKFPKLEFVIVGDGPDKSKIIGPVTIVGQKTPEEYKRIFLRSDVYLSTSNYEGWGMAITEALASGLPVVTTNTGCAEELIVDHKVGGIVTKINDVGELVNAVEKLLLNQKLRRRLVVAGQRVLRVGYMPDKLEKEFVVGLKDTL